MSTRIHFPHGLTTSFYPAAESSWERYTSTLTRYPCGVQKQGTAFAEVSYYETNVAAQYDMMLVQYISGPLQAQTINGTVKGQFQARQSSVDGDFCMAMVIKVITATGVTRGVLLSYFPNSITTELAAGFPVNRHCPPDATALTELAIEEGDRLVIEIGVRSFNTLTTTQYAYLTVGDAAAEDLPEDETETEYMNPWVEFTNTLAWQVETAYAAAGYMKLCGSCLLSGGDTEDITEYAADGCIQIVGRGC